MTLKLAPLDAARVPPSLHGLHPRDPVLRFPPGVRESYLTDVLATITARCRLALAGRRLEQRETVAGDPVDRAEAELDLLLDPPVDEGDLSALEHARDRLKRRWRDALPPAVQLAQELGLSDLAVEILWLAAGPSIWGELASVYGAIAGPAGRPQVDESLLGRLLRATAAGRRAIAKELHGDAPLVRAGLVSIAAGVMRPMAPIVVREAVVRRLTGDSFTASRPGDPVWEIRRDVRLADFMGNASVVAAITRELERPGGTARLALRGPLGVGRRTLAAALAARAGRGLGAIDLEGRPADDLAPALRDHLAEARIRGWLPLLNGLGRIVHDAPHCEVLCAVLAAHPGPVLLRLEPGPAGGLEGRVPIFDLAVPDVATRARVWRAGLADHGFDEGHASLLAERFAIGVGEIRRATQSAMTTGALPELVAAVRKRVDARLTSVATRCERRADWSELVLPAELDSTLRELVARVTHRGTVFDGWGTESGRGVTALFQGGPGTGKTLAAGAVAKALGYELYRVDLSRVASKWIGETQQNLASIFDAAAGTEVVLLFDEADALFAKRTEVRSSNDRHANGEVDYLLSRLDDFDGVAILTTNFGGNIDRAVLRRMTFRLIFPFPGEDERERLWQVHLPPNAPREPGLEFHRLAATFQMSGAAIRRSMLRALFAAAAEDRSLDEELLTVTVRREYADQGMLSDNTILE